MKLFLIMLAILSLIGCNGPSGAAWNRADPNPQAYVACMRGEIGPAYPHFPCDTWYGRESILASGSEPFAPVGIQGSQTVHYSVFSGGRFSHGYVHSTW